jgi:hypothetical protein
VYPPPMWMIDKFLCGHTWPLVLFVLYGLKHHVKRCIWDCAIVNIVVFSIKFHFCLLDFVIRCHALNRCGGKN